MPDFDHPSNVLTATALKGMMSVARFGVVVRKSEHLPVHAAIKYDANPDVMYVGRRTYRALVWETEARHAWTGRDWRRIKRERRKFLNRKALTNAR